MNRRNQPNGVLIQMRVLAVMAYALLLGFLLVSSGCHTPPGRTAYNVASGTQASVEVVMAGWNEYVGLKHPAIADELKVKAAYAQYQVAMTAVCDAGAIYAASTVTNSAGDTGLQAALVQARENAAQSLADLAALVRSFGIKF